MFRTELDFAFFASRFGWSLSDYMDTTPVQRAFVRKEYETKVVEDSTLVQAAVQTALANAYGKRMRKLWRKRSKEARQVVPASEVASMRKLFKKSAPWSPWRDAKKKKRAR